MFGSRLFGVVSALGPEIRDFRLANINLISSILHVPPTLFVYFEE